MLRSLLFQTDPPGSPVPWPWPLAPLCVLVVLLLATVILNQVREHFLPREH